MTRFSKILAWWGHRPTPKAVRRDSEVDRLRDENARLMLVIAHLKVELKESHGAIRRLTKLHGRGVV